MQKQCKCKYVQKRKILADSTPVLKKHNGCKFLNKACLYSHQHQVLQVHSHKHKHIQSFFVVCFFGTQSTYWAKHIISTNVGFYTFLLVRTVMYVSYLTEERRVWPLFSVTSWFVLEAWKQGQITEEHPNTAFSEQQYCALKFTHSPWHVHFSVLPFIQSPALCQIPKDSSTWLMLPVLAMIYSSPVSLPHCDRTKQLS